MPPGLSLIHFLKGHDVFRLAAFVCHPPKVFEVIQNSLNLDRSGRGYAEPDSAAILDAEAFPQLLWQCDLPLGGYSRFNGRGRIVGSRGHNALLTLYVIFPYHPFTDLPVSIIKRAEEEGREALIEPWMELQLLMVMMAPQLTASGRQSRTGWDPFRTVLLIMFDSGLWSREIFRMRWENIHWDKGLIFNPRGKSRKSRR